jgi:hypothetical protein
MSRYSCRSVNLYEPTLPWTKERFKGRAFARDLIPNLADYIIQDYDKKRYVKADDSPRNSQHEASSFPRFLVP